MHGIRRRDFITLIGGAVAWPLAAHAQQPTMPVIGFLGAESADFYHYARPFLEGLGATGYVEGRTVSIEYRWGDGRYERLPALAADLAGKKLAAIAAIGGPAAPAAKTATATIPIVFSVGGDPIDLHLVQHLNRPGGNVTGATFFAAELLPKQVELLHILVPKARTVGALVNPKNPRAEADTNRVQDAGRRLGLEILVASIATDFDLDAAISNLAQQHAEALITCGDPFLTRIYPKIATLAAHYRLPDIYGTAREANGLMNYGSSASEAQRQVGIYIGRILKGEKPGDLPVVQPTKFGLVINLRTARAIGLSVPPNLLAIADEVIE
jgi:putative ABC transport system substrate-binding protein